MLRTGPFAVIYKGLPMCEDSFWSVKACRCAKIRFGVSRLALTGKASFATPMRNISE